MKYNNHSGYVALLTVLVLGVIATTVATSLVLLGLGHTRTSLSEIQSASAKTAADACVDDALRQIKLTPSFTGNGSLTMPNSSCNYTVINSSTSSISATGISGNVTRRVTVDLSARAPNIIYTKWQES
jgi:hypothetical protein